MKPRRQTGLTGPVAREAVSDKISVLRGEGTPQRQAVATALSMQRAGRLRPGGVYVRAAKPRGAQRARTAGRK